MTRTIVPLAVLLAGLMHGSPAVAAVQGQPARALWNLAGTAPPPAGVKRPGATALALAGDQALFVIGTERRKKLHSIAIDGSSRAVDRLHFLTPGNAGIAVRLDASSQLSAALFSTLDQDPLMVAFTGPPLGPLAALAPLRGLTSGEFVPFDVQVAGDTLFVLEQRIRPRAARLMVRNAGGGSAQVTSLPLTREDRPIIAGELAAVVRRPSRPAAGKLSEVMIQRWRTGAGRRFVSVPIEVDSMDLHPGGRIVVNDVSGTIAELGVDGAVRLIARSGTRPAYAGNAIVYVTGDRIQTLMVTAPNRPPRPLGVPSAQIDGFAADARRVVWSAHGCLLAADLSARSSLRLPRGPCPRAEVALDRRASSIRLRSGGRVAVPVRCIAAPAEGCRGRVRLTAIVRTSRRAFKTRLGSAGLRIAPGARAPIGVRLSRRALALVRGKSSPPGFFGVQAEVQVEAVDPAGRRSARRECCARLVSRR
jgi:hypothetical protein